MKRILYLGLDPARFHYEGELVHLPLIQIVPHPLEEVKGAFEKLPACTHVLLTSRQAAALTIDYASLLSISFEQKIYLAVGPGTAAVLKEQGLSCTHVAQEACGEGVVALLSKLDLSHSFLFFPHSSLARPLVKDYLLERHLPHLAFPLYDTHPRAVALPDLEAFDAIVFTSPSTVEAFAACCPCLPPYEKCHPIGPITQARLKQLFGKHSTSS